MSLSDHRNQHSKRLILHSLEEPQVYQQFELFNNEVDPLEDKESLVFSKGFIEAAKVPKFETLNQIHKLMQSKFLNKMGIHSLSTEELDRDQIPKYRSKTFGGGAGNQKGRKKKKKKEKKDDNLLFFGFFL